MKIKIVDFFSKIKHFELFYIHIHNKNLANNFCSNTARAFNYVLRLAIQYFIANNYLPDDDLNIQLDERNERTGSRHFLEDYLHTELTVSGVTNNSFCVKYFQSENNKIIQIADVFSNLLYSHIINQAYTEEFIKLRNQDILKFTFHFPKD